MWTRSDLTLEKITPTGQTFLYCEPLVGKWFQEGAELEYRYLEFLSFPQMDTTIYLLSCKVAKTQKKEAKPFNSSQISTVYGSLYANGKTVVPIIWWKLIHVASTSSWTVKQYLYSDENFSSPPVIFWTFWRYQEVSTSAFISLLQLIFCAKKIWKLHKSTLPSGYSFPISNRTTKVWWIELWFWWIGSFFLLCLWLQNIFFVLSG